MDLYDAVNNRSSVRSFTDRDVPDGTVKRLLQAAVRAPTAGNLQPWRFLVVRDRRVKQALAEAAGGQSFIQRAPVVIVVAADLDASAGVYGSRGEDLYAIQDTAAAVENILLAVVAEGLGACWVGAFGEKGASAALGLGPRTRPLALLPVGHPVGAGRRTERIAVEEYTRYV